MIYENIRMWQIWMKAEEIRIKQKNIDISKD